MGRSKNSLSFNNNVTLEDLFYLSDKFCFLAGAGISIDAPSGLSSGLKFSKALLKQLVPKRELENVINLMNTNKTGLDDFNDFLRFEQILGYLYDQKLEQKEFQVLDCYSKCDTPNYNHLFLAKMIIEKKTPVFTTNFDSLIEYSMLKSGMQCDRIQIIINQKDWENIEVNFFNVYKIHGSLMNICKDEKCHTSIQATLRQIVKAKGGQFELDEWKRNILTKILEEYDLIVIGYSGLDDLDVMPTLWKIRSPKRIFWVQHKNGISFEDAKIESVKSNNKSKSISINRDDRILLNFIENKSRIESKVFRIGVDTSHFLKWLAEKFMLELPLERSTNKSFKKFKLSNLKLKEKKKWFFVGKVYYDRNLFEKSRKCYLRAYELAKDDEDDIFKIECLNEIGSFNKKSNPDVSLFFFNKQLILANKHNFELEIAKAYSNIGSVYHLMGDPYYLQAFSYYKDALKIAKMIKDREEEATILNNMADFFFKEGNFIKTKELIDESIRITEDLGDIWDLSDCYNNAGKLHQELGNESKENQSSHYDLSFSYFQKSLECSKKIGYKRGIARVLVNIAFLYRKRGLFVQSFSFPVTRVLLF